MLQLPQNNQDFKTHIISHKYISPRLVNCLIWKQIFAELFRCYFPTVQIKLTCQCSHLTDIHFNTILVSHHCNTKQPRSNSINQHVNTLGTMKAASVDLTANSDDKTNKKTSAKFLEKSITKWSCNFIIHYKLNSKAFSCPSDFMKISIIIWTRNIRLI